MNMKDFLAEIELPSVEDCKTEISHLELLLEGSKEELKTLKEVPGNERNTYGKKLISDAEEHWQEFFNILVEQRTTYESLRNQILEWNADPLLDQLKEIAIKKIDGILSANSPEDILTILSDLSEMKPIEFFNHRISQLERSIIKLEEDLAWEQAELKNREMIETLRKEIP